MYVELVSMFKVVRLCVFWRMKAHLISPDVLYCYV